MKEISISNSKKDELIKNLRNSDPNSPLLDTFNSMKFYEFDGSENKFIYYEGTGKYIIYLSAEYEIEVYGWDPLQACKIAKYCCEVLNKYRESAATNKVILGVLSKITDDNQHNWICILS